ncbi:hypothetical protein ABMA27_003394 [Loxostege sticticalis]|uniref:DDE Tnp4 domain-containing protein n=1 Tax=Loxostege sticticalis TaxID=481309 RepID=A0ABR3HT54_LOXSC
MTHQLLPADHRARLDYCQRVINLNLEEDDFPSKSDFFLWCFLKSRVYVNKPQTLAALKENIRQEITNISQEVNHGISPLHQILLTLRFYALGTMLVAVGDYIGVSKSAASRIVRDVSQAIARLYPKYIYVHSNTTEDFYNIARFPRVLGAIDGTHILMQSPNSNIGEEFRNRKSVFSMNMQGVCDANLNFMNVVARWPGSSHDATIFNNSELRGNSVREWGLRQSTPLLNPESENEMNYNRAHIKTRNTIERCIGVWKRRFPVLALKIRLCLETTQAVVIATSVLHNICRRMNLEELEPEIEIPRHNIHVAYENIPENHAFRSPLL